MTPDDRDDEPRAIDVVRRAAASGSDDEALDPATIAQLAAWFAPAPAAPPPPRRVDEDDAERRAYLEKLERACAAVEPAFLAWIGKIEHAGDGLRQVPPPLAAVDATLSAFDVSAWRLPGMDGEARTFPVPEDVEAAVHNSVPQAVLRDLHRPISHFALYLEVSEADREDAAARDALRSQRAARDVMRTPYAIRGFEPPAEAQVAAARADLVSILHGPWEKVSAVKMRALDADEARAAARWFR